MRDSKNKFYRTLELDEESKKILKWYRSVKKQLMDDDIEYEDKENE